MVRILKRARSGADYVRVGPHWHVHARALSRTRYFLSQLNPEALAGLLGQEVRKRNLFLRTSRSYDDDRYMLDDAVDSEADAYDKRAAANWWASILNNVSEPSVRLPSHFVRPINFLFLRQTPKRNHKAKPENPIFFRASRSSDDEATV